MSPKNHDGVIEIVRKNSLAAVQQNGRALEYVREQTPEICLAAVQQKRDQVASSFALK
jgi:hypothetical protein